MAKGYLLVGDPYGYWPFESEHPENTEYLAAFERGIYVLLDGMPMVRLTARPDAIKKDTSETYLLKAKNLSLEEFNKNWQNVHVSCSILATFLLPESDQERPLHGGTVYTVKVPKGIKRSCLIKFGLASLCKAFTLRPRAGWICWLMRTRNIFTKIMLAPISWHCEDTSVLK